MTSVLVKLDENLGQSHAELLRKAGHSVDRVTSTHCWVALSLRIQTTLVLGVHLLPTRRREGEPND
jgi:hypothetical protein